MGEPPLRLADIVTESALLLGAGSTVLAQLADRRIGLGVMEHSTTLDRPVDRLRATLTYVYVMALGSEAQRRAVARRVDRAHARVQAPGRYSAYDPELQLWVAATLTHNTIRVYEKVWGPLSPESLEQVCRDASVFGTALQVDAAQWPATVADFDAYWERRLDGLETDPAVQHYCRRLLDRRSHPRGLRWLAPLQSLVTRGNLDPRVRSALGLAWTARDQRRYDLFWRVFPPVYRAAPRPVRQLPARAALWDAGRRLGKR